MVPRGSATMSVVMTPGTPETGVVPHNMVDPWGSKTVAVNTYWWVVVMSLLVIGHLTGVMNFFHFSSGTPCTIFVEIWLVRW